MSSQKTRQRYTPEFKDDAVGLVIKQGYNCAEAGRGLGVNPNNIVRWVRQYRDQKEAAESGTKHSDGNTDLIPNQIHRLQS